MPPGRSTYFSLSLLSIAGLVASTPTVQTTNNFTYNGIAENGIEQFLNIPYGKAQRFGNPELFVFPKNVTAYNATTPSPMCPQPGNLDDISEDCLKLKLARPTGTKKGSKLPVMVFIYGGGLFSGNINDPSYEPEGLIKQSVENGLPVMYAAMNYRLGLFGFAQSEALKANKSLNVGLKDQRLALEWIQKNIESFGGDPKRVTIFGQSSGALSVGLQILAYGGTKPIPFSGAIMESTALEPGHTSNLTLDTFNAVTKLTNCSIDGKPQSSASLKCLRSLPLAKLLNITITQHDSRLNETTGDIYLPIVDGDFLPKASSELTNKGLFPKIPTVIGWNNQDAAPFTDTGIITSAQTRNFIHIFFPGLSNKTLSTLLDLYPTSDFHTDPVSGFSAEFYRAAQINRDALFTCPSLLLGQAMAKKYEAKKEVPAVFYFEQNQTVAPTPGFGVVHGSEMGYIFGLRNFNGSGLLKPSASDSDLQVRESRSWSGFAHTGHPTLDGKKTLVGWNSTSSKEAKAYVVGGARPGMSVLNDQKLKERCGFMNRDDVIKELQY